MPYRDGDPPHDLELLLRELEDLHKRISPHRHRRGWWGGLQENLGHLIQVLGSGEAGFAYFGSREVDERVAASKFCATLLNDFPYLVHEVRKLIDKEKKHALEAQAPRDHG